MNTQYFLEDLKPDQRQEFRAALIHAFPEASELGLMLEDELGKSLNLITQGQPNYELAVQELIKWAVSEGKVQKLLDEALKKKPDNPKLKKFWSTISSGSLVFPTPPFLKGRSALRFDGVRNYVDLGNPEELNFVGDITIEAWIKHSHTVTDDTQIIVAHGYARHPNSEVYLRLNMGTYATGSWDTNNYLAAWPIAEQDLNKWIHLAGSYSCKDENWTLFKDGELVAKEKSAKGALTGNGNWAIGAAGNGLERFFSGHICEVRLWKIARSSENIKRDMGRRLNGNEAGLVAYWPLDEEGKLEVYDLTNGMKGVIYHDAQWVSC